MQQSGGLLPSGVSAGCSLVLSSPISSTAKRILRDRQTRTHLNATVQWTVTKSVSRRMLLSVIESYNVHAKRILGDQWTVAIRRFRRMLLNVIESYIVRQS